MPSQAVRVMAIEQHASLRHPDSKAKPRISRLIVSLMFQGVPANLNYGLSLSTRFNIF
jgi:hypothetical protein